MPKPLATLSIVSVAALFLSVLAFGAVAISPHDSAEHETLTARVQELEQDQARLKQQCREVQAALALLVETLPRTMNQSVTITPSHEVDVKPAAQQSKELVDAARLVAHSIMRGER